MKIGFLVIATEVLEGKINDSNTKALSDFLKRFGLEVAGSMVCRDSAEEILEALTYLSSRYDLVVTSGGLGPTKDDITKDTLAKFLGKKIIFSHESNLIAEANYLRMGRTFPGKDHGYCYLPEGFIALSNSTGFAPCFYTHYDGKFLISGPGVPREFKSLLEDHFITILKDHLPKSTYSDNIIVRTKYIPEEKIFAEIDPLLWDRLEKLGDVSSLPFLMGVDIGVKVRANSQEELDEKKQATLAVFQESPLKDYIWHFGQESLEEKIVRTAVKKGITFGFAESATGGLCSNRITNIPGSSDCFIGAIVSYNKSVKESVLGVGDEVLAFNSAVSPEVAEQMASGALKKLNVDVAVSITGFAGPGEEQVGQCFVGRATKYGTSTFRPPTLKGDREVVKMRFSQAVLFSLLEELEKFAAG